MEKIRSYLSSWIGNLGVVPLFLSLAFLFCPALTLLFFLLFSVTAVLETIFQLLQTRLIQKRFLPLVKPYVKATPAILVIFFSFPLYGSDNLLISKGEHLEIKANGLTKFTLSNKDILSAKFLPKTQSLLIKGKGLGYSELWYWPQSGKKKTFGVYVLSKRRQLKLTHLADTLKNLGLRVSFKGALIYVKGDISDFSHYQVIKELKKKYSKDLYLQVRLSNSLSKKLTLEIYRSFWDEYIEDVKCRLEYIKYECIYDQGQKLSQGMLSHLKNKYIIDIISIKNFNQHQNFELHFKLIQLENLRGENVDLGLSQIESELDSFFIMDLKSIVKKNSVILQKRNIDISVLVDHKMILQLNKKSSIEFGNESSFPIQANQSIALAWKFNGLKLDTVLKKSGEFYHLKYSTMLTNPSQQGSSIKGSKSSSTISLRPNKTQQLFELGIKTLNEQKSQFPTLGQIPLLGYLFQANAQMENTRKVVALVKLKRAYQ